MSDPTKLESRINDKRRAALGPHVVKMQGGFTLHDDNGRWIEVWRDPESVTAVVVILIFELVDGFGPQLVADWRFSEELWVSFVANAARGGATPMAYEHARLAASPPVGAVEGESEEVETFWFECEECSDRFMTFTPPLFAPNLSCRVQGCGGTATQQRKHPQVSGIAATRAPEPQPCAHPKGFEWLGRGPDQAWRCPVCRAPEPETGEPERCLARSAYGRLCVWSKDHDTNAGHSWTLIEPASQEEA